MSYSDEQLSAFLDGELPETQMDIIRTALADDEALADRLAELALVDTLVAGAAEVINEKPLPESVEALLGRKATDASVTGDSGATGGPARSGNNNVLRLPTRNTVRDLLRPRPALAAAIAILGGLVLVLWQTPERRDTEQPAVAAIDGRPVDQWPGLTGALDSARSGVRHELANGYAIEPRLTFKNDSGQFCRQFEVLHTSNTEQAIACRSAGQWQVVVSLQTPGASPASDTPLYRTASGEPVLASLLDDMIAEGPYDAEREAELLETWSTFPGRTPP